MKRLLPIAIAVLLGCLLAAAQDAGFSPVQQRGREPALRSLQGTVKGKEEQPLEKAIVYLKNVKTLAVRTFITGADGQYRFHALSPNTDYDVFAEHEGRRSDTKTLSSFDSRAQAYINLKVDTSKAGNQEEKQKGAGKQ